MKAYIFTKYESDDRKSVIEKKVIISDKNRFEIMKLEVNGSYDWEECAVQFGSEINNASNHVIYLTCKDCNFVDMIFSSKGRNWSCPNCKYQYQPERLNPEDAKHSVFDSPTNANK